MREREGDGEREGERERAGRREGWREIEKGREGGRERNEDFCKLYNVHTTAVELLALTALVLLLFLPLVG